MRMSPGCLFKGGEIYQPFFNMREFDRSARRIKQQLRTRNRQLEEFHLLVLLLEEEEADFEHYC
jgi:hypothetical protein